METKSIYMDDNIEVIEDDVEKIRKKTEMYIGYKGSQGAIHLGKELIQNNIDEVLNPKSPGDTISVFLDEKNNMLVSSDNGRGIPFDKILDVSTKLQSGSKFDRDDVDDSAGENGVGLTAINALSHSLTYTVYRQVSEEASQKGIYRFEEGKFLDKKITNVKAAKHGTTVGFVPSSEILGPCKIDPDELYDWVNKMSYLISKKKLITLRILPLGSDIEKSWKFKHKNGFSDYVSDMMCDEQLIAPISIKGKKDDVKIEVVFTYNPKSLNETVDSFANYVNTTLGGEHVNASRFAVASCISKLANELLSDSDRKKFEITNDDCRTGLVMAVNLGCKHPGFTGQNKSNVGNRELYKPIRSIVYSQLAKHFKDNPKDLQKLVVYLKKVARSRLQITKIQHKDVASFDSFTAATMENFTDANGNSPYKELFLGEGLSAKGSIDQAKDPRFQAVLALRGLTMNTFTADIASIIKNNEFNTLIRVSGMGIGKLFNLKKSNYKKYIICTDADIDGSNITSSLSTFFLVNWRPVVEAGMLYKALTPLYKIKDGDDYRYLTSKQELFEAKVANYSKFLKLRDSNGHTLDLDEMVDFYTLNKNYPDILKDLYTYFYVHPDVLEYLVRFSKEKNFEKELHKRCPELKYEDGVVKGSYQGVFQFVPIDELFYKKTRRLAEMIESLESGDIFYDIYDVNTGEWDKGNTVGQVFKKSTKYDNKIIARWKGLGAIPPEIFWDAVLNPKKRRLVRLTVEDLEKDLYKMRVLHGSDPKLRRELLQTYKLDKDDLDN